MGKNVNYNSGNKKYDLSGIDVTGNSNNGYKWMK